MSVYCEAMVTLLSAQLGDGDLVVTPTSIKGTVMSRIAQEPGVGADCAEANASGSYDTEVPALVDIALEEDRARGVVTIAELGKRFTFVAPISPAR
jgi:hypothetical protein